MKTVNEILSFTRVKSLLAETNNLQYALTHIYCLYEMYPSYSAQQIVDKFMETFGLIEKYKQREPEVCQQIQRLYEEMVPTNVTAGIDASTPRIVSKEKKNVVHRNKKNQETIQ